MMRAHLTCRREVNDCDWCSFSSMGMKRVQTDLYNRINLG